VGGASQRKHPVAINTKQPIRALIEMGSTSKAAYANNAHNR
jgi:hypothetical protein